MEIPHPLGRLVFAMTRRPAASLALLVAIVVPLLAGSAWVRADNSLDAWFVEGDPALAAFHNFLAEYGSDELIMVAAESPDGARTPQEIALQQRIARRLERIRGVDRILVGAELPPARSHGIVAEDGRASALMVWMSARPDLEQERSRIVREVREAATAELRPSGREPKLAGTGVLYDALNALTIRDTGIFLSLALAVMVAILAVGLRSVRAVGLAVLAALLSAGAGMGIVGFSGRPFTVVSSALPTLVLVIALADAVHILLHYEQVRRANPPGGVAARRRQAGEAVAWVALPCLFTSLTTAAGFLALATSQIALVRDFGLFAAAGMLLAWLITIPLLTVGLCLLDVAPPARGEGGGFLNRSLAGLSELIPRRRRWIVAGSAVAAVVLIVGMTRVHADTYTIGLLPETHIVRADSDWIERRLGAYTPLEMLVTNPGIEDSEFARHLAMWRAAVEKHPRVDRTFTTPADPATPLGDRHTSRDGRTIRVTVFVPMMTARGIANVIADIEREGAREFGSVTVVKASGYLPLYTTIIEYVVQSTVWGLGLAFVLVFILMAFLVRSPRGMLAAVPTNVLPLLLVFGVMGWFGIPLDLATATVGAVVLGIVVDDTIHFLHRYQQERRSGGTSAESVRRSILSTGRSIVLTSLVLGGGFAVLMAAGARGIVYFGLVATLAIIGAALADMLLLSALLTGNGTGREESSAEGVHAR